MATALTYTPGEERVHTAAGFNIEVRSWRPHTRPRGVVAIVQTRPSGSQFFYDRAGSSDKTLKLYEGHAHDLLNDVDRQVVMADIQGWMNAHLPAA